MNECLAAIQAEALGRTGDGIVGHGQEDQLRLVEYGERVGKGARAGHHLLEPAPALLVPAGNRRDVPAGTREGSTKSRTNPACSYERDVWPAVVGVLVLVVGVVVGVFMIGVVVGHVGQLSASRRGVYSAGLH